MLVKDPEVPGGRRVKILDFGLAKVAVKHQSNAVMTREGVIMGTPSYMPPEQWMSATLVDAKSDVYSLGVMLFEMLTGRRPFIGENTNQVMVGHLYDEPPKVTEFAPEITTATAQLVSLMLNKTRGSRPTMYEVSQSIERLLAIPSAPASPVASKPTPLRGSPSVDSVMAPTMLQSASVSGAAPAESPQWTDLKIGSEEPTGPSGASSPALADAQKQVAIELQRAFLRPRRGLRYILLAMAVLLAAVVGSLLIR